MIKNQGSAAILLAGAMLLTGVISPDAALAKKGGSCAKSSKCCKAASKKCTGNKNDIVNTAKRDGSFKTLSNALCCTGLSSTLHGKGPFTVFAPSDEAFAKLPKDKQEAICRDANTLKYHVVKGKVSSADLASKRSIVTVQGEALMVNNKDNTIIIDGATVTKPDIACSNGVIHVIDFVLVPERGK